jgi:hypothetical protein
MTELNLTELYLTEGNLKSAKYYTDEVNKKYFEMGGKDTRGYMSFTNLLEDIIDRELGDDYLAERYVKSIEEDKLQYPEDYE